MFKKILYADDLSKRAVKALEVALNLARIHGAALTILNVREDFLNKDEMVMLRVDVSDFQGKIKEKALAARKRIQSDIEALKGQDVKTEILLREGKPSKEVIAVAQELDVDLIVVGSHGVTTLKDKVFGTTAEAVVHQASRNVLSVWTRE